MPIVRSIGLPILVVASLSCVARQAQAAAFCVDSQSSFQSALNTASTNQNFTNIITVVAGTYHLTSGLFYQRTAAGSDLSILGGYSAGCATRTFAATELDGQHTLRPLNIRAANATIVINGLDFVAGLSTNNRGGGLSIYTNPGRVRIELNRFIGNRADDFGGGLFVSTAGGGLSVNNNLFIANTAAVDGGAELFANADEAYVTNNTIIGNSADTSDATGGLNLTGGSHYTVSNNILWNNNANGAADFRSGGGHLRLNNDIGTSTGAPPDSASAGNVSVDPEFQACGLCLSFELSAGSPLIDSGTNTPPGGLLTIDLLNHPRVAGGVVDIGAFESERLFADGFE